MRAEGMFVQARSAGLDMDALGDAMAACKEDLLADIKANGLPAPKIRSFTGLKLVQDKPVETV